MKRDLVLFMIVVVALTSTVFSFGSPSATAKNAMIQVTIPTTYSSTSVTSTSSTSTSTTTSTSSSTSKTTTSTTTTSTFTSFSYTSSTSVTVTNSSTLTSFTGTHTATTTSSSMSTSLATSSTTSTTTVASTSTIAVFPGCLIATAAFGSELAPEVQLLRGFRDSSILSTEAGSGFMVAFNAWYYSFSPAVAGYLYTHSAERMVVRGVLYPLIEILKLSSMTFSAAGAVPELAALLSGLVASSLIGAFYVGLPLGLLGSRIRRLRGGRTQILLEKVLGLGLLSGLGALLLGEVIASPMMLTAASVTVVLSTLFLSATATSAGISRRLHAA